MRNLLALLPDGHVPVQVWVPHPEGGWYVAEAWVYGPGGRVGYWMDEAQRLAVGHVELAEGAIREMEQAHKVIRRNLRIAAFFLVLSLALWVATVIRLLT